MPDSQNTRNRLQHGECLSRLQIAGGKGSVCLSFLHGVWPIVAAFLFGSVLTIGAFLLDQDHHHSLGEGLSIFGGILIFLLVSYRFLFKLYQTERACHAAQLTQADQYLHLILDSMLHGFLLLDGAGCIQGVNRAALALTGCVESELLGRDVDGLFASCMDHEESLLTRDQIRSKILSGSVTRMELLLETRHNASLPVRIATSSLQRDDGHWIILMIQDVTQFRQLQQLQSRWQEQLHEEVRQRTGQLNASMMAAHAANQAKNAFLADFSHALRTPMSTMIGMTDLVLQTPLQAEQRERLLLVQSASHTLMTLMNGMLDLVQIEEGRIQVEKTSFELRPTLENLCEFMAMSAHEKDLEMYCYLSPEIPDVLVGDPKHLAQILMNLISNAVQFTQAGEVTLLVQPAGKQHPLVLSRSGADANKEIVLTFSVADTGIGIAKEQQEKIGACFRQADGAWMPGLGASGLGLTLCKGLVELMGGEIRAESEEGEGSIFHITLCFGIARRPSSEDDVAVGIVGQPLAGVRVLIVDANPTGRMIATEMLHGLGAHVGEAEDMTTLFLTLEQAREQNRPWEVMLLDHKVIRRYGEQLEAVKGHAGWSGKVVLQHTSNRTPALLPGAPFFSQILLIPKPIQRLTLLRVMHTLLERIPSDINQNDDTFLAGNPSVASLHILLVEEQEENRKLAAAILEKVGHRVTQVKDGQDAMERMATGQRFDLVVLDLNMPHMDGYEVTRRMRAGDDVLARIPIVAVAARSLPGEKALCLASGMNEYLVKPYRPVDLLNTVSLAALKHRSVSSSGEAGEVAAVLQPVGDAVLFQEASSLYLKGPYLLLENLKTALEEKNLKRTREESERIKKLAIALGAERVKDKTVRLGVATRSEEWLKANKLYKELEVECVKVYEILMDRLPKEPPDPSTPPAAPQ